MISELDIPSEFSALLSRRTEAGGTDETRALLTPVEYPGGDLVVVYIRETADRRVIVSDLGGADATVAKVDPGITIKLSMAETAVGDLGVQFTQGQVTGHAEGPDDLASLCWRVAQASSRVASACLLNRRSKTSNEFSDLIADAFERAGIEVKRNVRLAGASGREYRTGFFEPRSELVIEPVTTVWPKPATVFTEFSDLGSMNGYKFLAVLDDREGEDVERTKSLLSGVAKVGTWSRRDSWVELTQ